MDAQHHLPVERLRHVLRSPRPARPGTNQPSSPTVRPPTAGWNQRVHCGMRKKLLALPQQQLDERHRNQPAHHAQHGVGSELHRVINWYAGTWNSGSSPNSRCSTIQDVAELSTIDPSTGACISPMTSSRVKSTAAIGVLNAAASAAAAPTGTSAFTLARREPQPPPKHRGDAAPTCTDGPSRPSAIRSPA